MSSKYVASHSSPNKTCPKGYVFSKPYWVEAITFDAISIIAVIGIFVFWQERRKANVRTAGLLTWMGFGLLLILRLGTDISDLVSQGLIDLCDEAQSLSHFKSLKVGILFSELAIAWLVMCIFMISLELRKKLKGVEDVPVAKVINAIILGILFLSAMAVVSLYSIIYPTIFLNPTDTLITVFNVYRKILILHASVFLFAAIYITVFMLMSLSGPTSLRSLRATVPLLGFLLTGLCVIAFSLVIQSHVGKSSLGFKGATVTHVLLFLFYFGALLVTIFVASALASLAVPGNVDMEQR